jgi:MFS family permease
MQSENGNKEQGYNKVVFYAYRILSRAYFHLPILFIYFHRSIQDVLTLEIALSVYAFTIAAFSNFSNFLFRIFGRLRYVVAAGEILKGIGLFLLLFSNHFTCIIIGQFIGGLGFAICIGADSSLLRSQYGEQELSAYQKVESYSVSMVFPSLFLAGVIGSILYGMRPATPFFISIAMTILAAIMIMKFKEKKPFIQKTTDKSKVRIFSASLFLWVLYYVVTRASIVALFIGLLPLYLEKSVKLPASLFGVFLGVFSVMAFWGARYSAKWINEKSKLIISFLMTFILTIGIFTFVLFQNKFLAFLGIALLGASAGVVRPLVYTQLNKAPLTSFERTELLSKMETVYGYVNGFLLIVVGVIIKYSSLYYALISVGILPIFLILFVLFSFITKENNKYIAFIRD